MLFSLVDTEGTERREREVGGDSGNGKERH